MRVVIVENTRVTHHGQVGVALHEAGALVQILRPWAGDVLPDEVTGDALVVFGGEQSARDDAAHPYLPALARLMADWSAADRPVLGICLGAQVLARAFGAENLLDRTLEFGWCEVALTDAGREDPVLGVLPARFPIFQWHSDTFTLPDGAVRLAGSAAAAQQAFRIGRATYGIQFHFEVSRAVAFDWARTFPDLVDQIAPGWRTELPDLAERDGVRADAHGLAVAQAWVALI